MKKNDPGSRGTAEGRKEGRKKWFWSGDGLAEVARPPRGRAPPLVVPEQSVSLENGRALANEQAREVDFQRTDGRKPLREERGRASPPSVSVQNKLILNRSADDGEQNPFGTSVG